MPRKSLPGLPFPPLARFDTDEPLTEAVLQKLFKKRRRGLSLCVRSKTGHANRGGYFFHLLPTGDGRHTYGLYDFEKNLVIDLTLAQVTALINHCSGLAFSAEVLSLFQTVINLRSDPQGS
jgi:hypothetical protein